MDKYLTMFSEQIDVAFQPETLFPDKKIATKEWILQKFIAGKNRKKSNSQRPVINNVAQAKLAV